MDEVKLTYISGLSDLTANVFSSDGDTQRNDGNAVTLSDTGHLGLYLGDCTDIRIGDVMVFYLNDVYLTGQTYEDITIVLAAVLTGGVLDLAMCNLSLNMLGAKEVSAGSPNETNYVFCEALYPEARNEILANHPWNINDKLSLAIQTTNPLFGYDNAFTKPSDCLRVWTIAQDPAAIFKVRGNTIHTDEGETPSDWATSTDYIVGQVVSNDDITYTVTAAHTSGDDTDEPGTGANAGDYWDSEGGDYKYLETEYSYLATDATSYPPYLRQCVVLNLAIKLATAIQQDVKAGLGFQEMLYGSPRVTGYLSQARSYDAQESGGVKISTTTFLNARR